MYRGRAIALRIYFLRHGETDWNREKRLQGRTDIPLNAEGRRVADLTGRGMAELRIDFCVTSPLSRARETAARILRENRFYLRAEHPETLWPNGAANAWEEIPLFCDDRLIERGFGAWEGLYFAGEHYNLPVPAWPNGHTPEGGESHDAVRARIRSFFEELSDRFGGTECAGLVVAHGGVLRAAEYVLTDGASDPNRIPPNCEALILEPDNAGRLRMKGRRIYGV